MVFYHIMGEERDRNLIIAFPAINNEVVDKPQTTFHSITSQFYANCSKRSTCSNVYFNNKHTAPKMLQGNGWTLIQRLLFACVVLHGHDGVHMN